MEPVALVPGSADFRMIIVGSRKDVNGVLELASKSHPMEHVVEVLASPVSEASLEFVALRLDGVAQLTTTAV